MRDRVSGKTIVLLEHSRALPTGIRCQASSATLPLHRGLFERSLKPARNRYVPAQTHRAFHTPAHANGITSQEVREPGNVRRPTPMYTVQWRHASHTGVVPFLRRAARTPVL